jgi:hypothetical protein
MKLLKTTLLLAAAATASQTYAADYRATWDLGSGQTATAIIGVSQANGFYPNTTNTYYYGDTNSWLTRLDFTVRDSNNVEVMNRTITDVFRFRWDPQGNPIDTPRTNLGFGAAGRFWIDTLSSDYQTFPNGELFLRVPFSAFVMRMSYFGPAGVVDIPVWLSSVNNQNRVYAAGTTLASLPLEGAHHRPMMSFDRMGKDAQFWATGDFGTSSRVRDVNVASGEVGVNKDIGANTLAGFAIGRGQQNQNLALDGSNNVIGNYFLGEIDYRPFGGQWIVSLLGMVGSWDAKVNRGYSNGGSTDYSLGETDIITRSARLRIDAPVLFSVAGFGFSPYASYAVTQTTVDAYTENSGGLPASYEEQQHNATEARLGVMATKVIDAKTKLIVSLEGIHRFDGEGPALTGQDITGSVGFSLPGQAPRPDCVRLGVDVDYKLATDTLLNVSAHASTVGEVADVSGAISIRRAF